MIEQWEVSLKPCPWCHKTPEIDMPLENTSWCWKVECRNLECVYQPTGRYITIRKDQRYDLKQILAKLLTICDLWNAGSWDMKPFEKLLIPLEDLHKFIQNRKEN